MFYTTAGSLGRLRDQVATMRTLAVLPEERLYATKDLSKWSTAEHVDHITRVSLAMLRGALRDDLPAQPKAITAIGRFILAVGWIPRGKGRAPEKYKGVRVPAEQLLAQLSELDAVAAGADSKAVAARRAGTIPHPYFGGLTPSQALRFIAIHNEHHLRIVRELLG